METKVKQLEESVVELTVKLGADEVDKQVNNAYRQAGKARIPGFRAGKAPRKVLENNFGGKEYFLANATEELVRATAPRAIDGEGLVALKEPEFKEFDLVAEGQEFSYSFTLKITPRLELSSYDPVKIELPSAEPTEDEIQERINSLREYYVEYEEVADRGVQDGDSLVIQVGDPVKDVSDSEDDADGQADSNAEDSANEMTYDMGSASMPVQFDEGLKGMTVGQTKDIEVTFEAAPGAAAAATPTSFKVTVKAIRVKNLPELTDAWVKDTIEYDGIAELRSRITESIKESKEADLPPLREVLASQKLALRLQGEPPEEMVKQTEQNNYQDFFRSLQENRTTFDQYLSSRGLTSEKFREQMHAQAVNNATIALALDAYARNLALTASDEEVFDEFKRSGVENPRKLFEDWREKGRLSEIREGLLRMKAARHLYDTAEVFEPGTLVEDQPQEAKKALETKKPASKRKTTTKKSEKKQAETEEAETERAETEEAETERALKD